MEGVDSERETSYIKGTMVNPILTVGDRLLGKPASRVSKYVRSQEFEEFSTTTTRSDETNSTTSLLCIYDELFDDLMMKWKADVRRIVKPSLKLSTISTIVTWPFLSAQLVEKVKSLVCMPTMWCVEYNLYCGYTVNYWTDVAPNEFLPCTLLSLMNIWGKCEGYFRKHC